MHKRRVTKETITRVVLNELPEGHIWTFETAMSKWWANIRKQGGLRLTDLGDQAMKDADLEFYEYPLELTATSKTLPVALVFLQLNNVIECPYYIGVGEKRHPFIRLYDSKVAIMVSLYGGINEYLASIGRKHDRRKETK